MKTRARMGREDGAAAVEMALILALLFTLLFGIIWYGWTFTRWMGVTHAAREGVRQLSIGIAAAQAESDAVDLSSGAGASIGCVASVPADDRVKMTCSVDYPPPLLFFSHSGQISSEATMRKE
jgi:Flp pilus assembly protein TadG